MSKERSEFEQDYVENVESPPSTRDIQQKDEDSGEPFVFTVHHALTIIVLFAGYLADIFVADLAFPLFGNINADIGPAPENFYWLLLSCTLGSMVPAPLIGRLSDVFGRKYVQMAASVLGIIGACICGRAERMAVIIGGMGIIGISTAGHQLAWASIVEIFPRNRRAMTVGLILFALTPAAGFSCLIAAGIKLHGSWRSIYWLALSLYAFSLVGTFLFYHPEKLPTQRTDTSTKRLTHFDYIGGFLSVTGIGTVAFGLVMGGTVFHWISVGVFVPVFLGIAVIIVFSAWVLFNRSRYPLIPRSLLSLPAQFWVIYAALFFIGMVGSTTNGLFPTQVQILYTQDPLPYGLFTMTYGLATSLFAPIAGFLFFPRYSRWIFGTYTTLLFVVMSAQAIVGEHTAAGSTAIVALVGAMHGATIAVSTVMIQLMVSHEDLGLATSTSIFFYQAGGVAYGIIDQVMIKNKIKPQLIALVVPALIEAGIPFKNLIEAVTLFSNGVVTGPAFAGASPEGMLVAVEKLKEAFTHVFHYVYLVSILFGGIAAVLSFFAGNIKTPVTSHVDARLSSSRSLLPFRKREL